jgi:hypothetical protein
MPHGADEVETVLSIIDEMYRLYLDVDREPVTSDDPALFDRSKYYLGSIRTAKEFANVPIGQTNRREVYNDKTKDQVGREIHEFALSRGGRLVKRDLSKQQEYDIVKHFGTFNKFKKEYNLEIYGWMGNGGNVGKPSQIPERNAKTVKIPDVVRSRDPQMDQPKRKPAKGGDGMKTSTRNVISLDSSIMECLWKYGPLTNEDIHRVLGVGRVRLYDSMNRLTSNDAVIRVNKHDLISHDGSYRVHGLRTVINYLPGQEDLVVSDILKGYPHSDCISKDTKKGISHETRGYPEPLRSKFKKAVVDYIIWAYPRKD